MDKSAKCESVWVYFDKKKGSGICKIEGCNKTIKAEGGSTSGLHSHLKLVHKLNLLKRNSNEPQQKGEPSKEKVPDLSKKNISDYFTCIDKSLPAIISRLVSLDGLAFLKICTSYDIRELLKAVGHHNLPKSANTIRKTVLDYAEKKRKDVREELNLIKEKGTKFSLTLDEWTSKRNRRYMNVNVHKDKKFWNLGLCRIKGTMPAEKCKTIMNEKLQKFGLSLEDIVATTTDGASVMKKFGRLLKIIHQLCFAHGIHLAVVKCFYKKKKKGGENKDGTNEAEVEDNEEEVEADWDEENNDFEINLGGNEDDFDDDEQAEDEIHEVDINGKIFEMEEFIENELDDVSFCNEDVSELISKVRKVVKLFRRSCTKNEDFLQDYILKKFKKEKQLILDIKTRWNSLLSMLTRFQEVIDCVSKSLIDLKIDISFSENDKNLLKTIIDTLEPVKVCVESLCSENATLFTADVALKFMLDNMPKDESENEAEITFSSKLKQELIKRIKERRTVWSDVLQFLHNPDEAEVDTEYEIFNHSSKAVITKHILEIAERLAYKEKDSVIVPVVLPESTQNKNKAAEVRESNEEENVDDPGEDTTSTTPVLSLKEKLKEEIKRRKTSKVQKELPPENNSISDFRKIVKKEITLFTKENVRGKYLDKVYDYLTTIKPTSVEAERAFSIAGYFCSKIRTRLGDDSLDSICFLRNIFKKQGLGKVCDLTEKVI